MNGKVITHPETLQRFWLDTGYVNDNKYHGGRRSNPRDRRTIVVHHTAGSTPGDLAVLRGKTATRVSVKHLVPDYGDASYTHDGMPIIYQLLPDDMIGWSIGTSTGKYAYVTNSNSDSIEVSNLGTGKDPFEKMQILAVEALIAYEERRLDQDLLVLGHRQTSPGRKPDPHVDFPLSEVVKFADWVKEGDVPSRTYAWCLFLEGSPGGKEKSRVSAVGRGDKLAVLDGPDGGDMSAILLEHGDEQTDVPALLKELNARRPRRVIYAGPDDVVVIKGTPDGAIHRLNYPTDVTL